MRKRPQRSGGVCHIKIEVICKGPFFLSSLPTWKTQVWPLQLVQSQDLRSRDTDLVRSRTTLTHVARTSRDPAGEVQAPTSSFHVRFPRERAWGAEGTVYQEACVPEPVRRELGVG